MQALHATWKQADDWDQHCLTAKHKNNVKLESQRQQLLHEAYLQQTEQPLQPQAADGPTEATAGEDDETQRTSESVL